MILSVFPEAKALPTKEEKNKEAWFTSKPNYPVVLKFDNEDDLIDIITKHCWSPSIFNGYRNQKSFVQTDLMVLDIDEGMTIEEAEQVVTRMGVAALALPSTSHTTDNHRFRLIFPLSKTIYNKEDFEATMTKLAEFFPADQACIGDTARFFFGCRDDAGFWQEGNLFNPIKAPKKPKNSPIRGYDSKDVVEVGESLEELVEALYGETRTKIPEPISYFLDNAHTGLPGEWFVSANSFIFTCGLLNLEFERVSEVFATVAPEPLDSTDTRLLERSFQDGLNKRDVDLQDDL